MILDANANLGNWPFRRMIYNDPEGLLERLGRVEIDRAWVVSLEAVMYKDVHAANAPLAEMVADYPALMPIATINPEFPAWQGDLAECVQELGFRGVRAYPNYHGYALDDPIADDLLALADDLDIFVQVAVRMTDERHHHPLCTVPPVDLGPLPELAAKYPKLPIMVVNGKNTDLMPLIEPTQGMENLFFEMSHIEGTGGLEELGRRLGLERIVFGTHAPYYYPESAILKVTRECEFTEAEQEAILHANADRLLAASGG